MVGKITTGNTIETLNYSENSLAVSKSSSVVVNIFLIIFLNSTKSCF